jgi:hypothetical protein
MMILDLLVESLPNCLLLPKAISAFWPLGITRQGEESDRVATRETLLSRSRMEETYATLPRPNHSRLDGSKRPAHPKEGWRSAQYVNNRVDAARVGQVE